MTEDEFSALENFIEAKIAAAGDNSITVQIRLQSLRKYFLSRFVEDYPYPAIDTEELDENDRQFGQPRYGHDSDE